MNEYLEAAKLALASPRFSGTMWDRTRRAMEASGIPTDDPYRVFMVGRYVGELLERSGNGHSDG